MNNRHLTIVNRNHYVGYEYQANHGGLIQEILQGNEEVLAYCAQWHSRLICFRVDLHFPSEVSNYEHAYQDAPSVLVKNDIQVISRFNKRLMYRFVNVCKIRGRHARFAILWVRELNSNGEFHYHLFICTSQDIFFSAGSLEESTGAMGMFNDAWNIALGLPAEPPYHVYLADWHTVDFSKADAEQKKNKILGHASYMAKVDTKPFNQGVKIYDKCRFQYRS